MSYIKKTPIFKCALLIASSLTLSASLVQAAGKATPATKMPPKAEAMSEAITPDNVTIVPENAKSTKPPVDNGMKFNTDSPSESTDVREPLKFNVPGVNSDKPAEPATFSDTGMSEDDPYRAYVGYPKNQAGAFVEPQSLSSKWTLSGQDFNFESDTTTYGVFYRFIPTPIFSLDLEWSHFEATTEAGTVSPFLIQESTETYDNYGLRGEYCIVGQRSFFWRLCPGASIGKEAYPILAFDDAVRLSMGKVEDIVFGASVSFQVPFSENFLFKTLVQYNFGTGMGNSGNLTSEKNSSLTARPMVTWAFHPHQDLSLGIDYQARKAELSGKVGSATYDWETNSTSLGGRLAYGYTF